MSILARSRGTLRTVAWSVFAAVVVITVVSTLRDDETLEAIARMSRPEAVPWLILSLATNLLGLFVGVIAWRELMAGMGSRLDVLTSSHIAAVGLLGKLIPGPLWGVLAEVDLARKAGVPPTRTMTHNLLYLVVVVVTGGALGCVAALSVFGAQAIWFVIPFAAAVAALVRPGVIGRGVGWVLARLRRPYVIERPSPRSVCVSSLIQVGAWCVAGLHLWAIAVALGASPGSGLVVCVGAFAFANVAGAAVIFLPDGIGVREVIIVVALSKLLPVSSAEVATVASRLCCLVSELGAAGSTVLLQMARLADSSKAAQ